MKLNAQERQAFRAVADRCGAAAARTPEDCWHQHAAHVAAAARWRRAASWGAVARWTARDQRAALEAAGDANGDAPPVVALAVQLLNAGTPLGDCLPAARAIGTP